MMPNIGGNMITKVRGIMKRKVKGNIILKVRSK